MGRLKVWDGSAWEYCGGGGIVGTATEGGNGADTSGGAGGSEEQELEQAGVRE
jgi:hypothetical protein